MFEWVCFYVIARVFVCVVFLLDHSWFEFSSAVMEYLNEKRPSMIGKYFGEKSLTNARIERDSSYGLRFPCGEGFFSHRLISTCVRQQTDSIFAEEAGYCLLPRTRNSIRSQFHVQSDLISQTLYVCSRRPPFGGFIHIRLEGVSCQTRDLITLSERPFVKAILVRVDMFISHAYFIIEYKCASISFVLTTLHFLVSLYCEIKLCCKTHHAAVNMTFYHYFAGSITMHRFTATFKTPPIIFRRRGHSLKVTRITCPSTSYD